MQFFLVKFDVDPDSFYADQDLAKRRGRIRTPATLPAGKGSFVDKMLIPDGTIFDQIFVELTIYLFYLFFYREAVKRLGERVREEVSCFF